MGYKFPSGPLACTQMKPCKYGKRRVWAREGCSVFRAASCISKEGRTAGELEWACAGLVYCFNENMMSGRMAMRKGASRRTGESRSAGYNAIPHGSATVDGWLNCGQV